MVKPTNYPSIKNAPLAGLAEGNGSFSNVHLAAAVLIVPYVLKSLLPIVSRGGFKTYLFLLLLSGVPTAVGYWAIMSTYGSRKNYKVSQEGRGIDHYLVFHNPELKKLYGGPNNKIPMQIFHDAYFEGKIDLRPGIDHFELMENRYDWASFNFTLEMFKYVFFTLIPDVISHSRSQDEDQVRDHYDRGDDFYSWFLGPRMIYTSGIIGNPDEEETLEQLQDNKLSIVCQKIGLKEGDRLLDIGCGWGTLVTFAAMNYGAHVTGVTLSKNQAQFGRDRMEKNGVDTTPKTGKGRILCCDYREIPEPLEEGSTPDSVANGHSAAPDHAFGWTPGRTPGRYDKITALEMAEHVGIRRYPAFLKQIYNLLEDDGIFFLQVAGFRETWYFEDLVWGLFMNKYIFPGADASCSLGWVVSQVQSAGFEVRSIDVLGVHYSATLWKWYINWTQHEKEVKEKYGEKWWRVWGLFLAWSTIISRQGSCSVFQLTLHKNLNAFHRVEGIKHHAGIKIDFTGLKSVQP